MKKKLLPLMCSFLLVGGGILTSQPQISNEHIGAKEIEKDILVYASKLEGESKIIKKATIIGDSETAHSKTYCQLGTTDDGHYLIRFFTAVKGEIEKLQYVLTYAGEQETIDITKVYKGITIDGKTQYYNGTELTETEGDYGYYLACFTVEYKSKDNSNIGLTAELTITDSKNEEHKAEKKSTSLGILADGNEIAFDGYMNDSIWSDEVKSSSLTVRDDDISKITAYATKGEKGVYVFVDYASKYNNSSATDWWYGNNFEATFTGKDGVLVNRNEFNLNANESNRVQCWTSQHNGTNLHNWSEGYLSSLTQDTTTGMYKMTFEMFMSYDDLGNVKDNTFTSINKDNAIAFGVGAPIYSVTNDDNTKDWKNTDGYRHGLLYFNPTKITDKGIFNGTMTEDQCTTHDYGDWEVTTQPDCENDGEKTRTCACCGHKDTAVVESTGKHNYDESNLTTITASTCKTHGTATAPCTGGCGSTKNVELPLDSDNHESEYNESLGYYPCCGEQIKDGNPIVNSANDGRWNWGDISTWTFIAKNLKGDYNVTVTYSSKTNSSMNTNAYAHTLAVVEEQLADGANGYGSVWVNRLDWWMWCDQWQSSSRLTNQADNGGTVNTNKNCWTSNGQVNDEYYNTYADCSIILTFTRTGKTVRNEFVITSNTTGKSYTYWTQITDVDTSKNLSLALVAEFATFTVTSIKYNNVTFA